jgi:hypothetical protein
MVSSTMAKKLFGHSIGGPAASAPITTHGITVGGGYHDPSRANNKAGLPAPEPARAVPAGAAKPHITTGAPKQSPKGAAVAPTKGKSSAVQSPAGKGNALQSPSRR